MWILKQHILSSQAYPEELKRKNPSLEICNILLTVAGRGETFPFIFYCSGFICIPEAIPFFHMGLIQLVHERIKIGK